MRDLTLMIPGTGGTPSVRIAPPAGIPTGSEYSLGYLATSFLDVAMLIGILLSLLYFVYGGFYWLQSKGDKEKLDHARRIIVYSVLGIVVMALALVIVNVVSNVLGVTSLIE